MYKLPITLKEDIERFGKLVTDYQEKKIEAVQFKANRVPMGVYEQRQDEVYMSRVRTPGGVIYPEQFLRLIEIAHRYKSNLLHITTRQEVQIQNLDLSNVEPILSELQEIGLATKGGGGNTIRNIIVSEESGISAEEQFDTTPYAMELTSWLIAESDSYLLPRKMKIAFSSNDKEIGYAAINDVGFVAKIKDGEKGFQVYAGGGGGAKPTVGWVLFDFVPVTELYVLAKALKNFFSEHGNRKNRHRARLRFIFYKLGVEETHRLIKEYYREAKKTEPIFILGVDMEDERPSYSYQPQKENTQAIDKEYISWKKRYVKPQRQRGYNSILVPFHLGNIPLNDEKTISGLQKLLRFIDRFGKHTLRFTSTQNVRLRNIPDEALEDVYLILKEIVNGLSEPVLVNNIVSCTGADTCRLGIGLSKGLAAAIREELRKSDLPLDKFANVRIHISGCPNSCGQQYWGDIGFSGKVLRNNRPYPGYQVYLAANRTDAPKFSERVGSINARDIPKFICRLLGAYNEVEHEYPTFTSYLETGGKSVALQLLEEYKIVPSFAEDKNYYFDWGAENIFSVVTHGAPECSAGLFDMIEVDLALINSHKAAFEKESDTVKKNSLLYDILYSSSRMLLVTRGLEPKTTQEIFNFFVRFFIDYGFVEERFKDLVLAARDNNKDYDFILHKEDIYALANSVIELYKNMDDSLQFKNVKQKETQVEQKEASQKENTLNEILKFKDLRGVACPMNFVQTKIQLVTMQSGEILEIWLDDGQPINNVPGSVQSEGHEVLEQVQINEDYWKVIIKKK